MTGATEMVELDRLARENWLSEVHESERRPYSELPLSTHGLLLQYDIERAFCAGAWLSVIVLVQSAIEATIRDIDSKDYETKAFQIFAGNNELERIRAFRNEILHPLEPGSPSKVWTVSGGDVRACHASLEDDAKLAVQRMYIIIYRYRKA